MIYIQKTITLFKKVRSDNLKPHLQRNKYKCELKKYIKTLPKGVGQALKIKLLIGQEIMEIVEELKIPRECLGGGTHRSDGVI